MTRFISIVAILALAAAAQAQDARPARNVLILPFVMQNGQAHQAWLGPALFDNLQKQATTAGHTLAKAPAEALNPDGSLRPVADEAQAKRLGEAAGAELVLFGTFGVSADQFNINGLMLDVRSGQVIGEVRGGGLLRDLLGVEAGLTEQMLALLEGRQPQVEPMAEPAPAVPYDNQVPYVEQPGIVDPYVPYPETVVVEQPVLVYPESYGYWSVGFGYGYSSYGYCGPRYNDYYYNHGHRNIWDYRADRREHFDDHRDVNNDRGPRFREGERSSNSSDRVYSDRGSDRSRSGGSTTSSDRRVVTVNGAGRVSEAGQRDDSAGTVTTARTTGGATARSGGTSRFREGGNVTTSRAEPSPSPAPTPSSGSRTVRSTERTSSPTPSRAAPPTTTRRESPAPSRSAPPAEARNPAPSRSAPPADSARSSRSEDRGSSFRSGGSSGGSSRDTGGSSRSSGGSSRSSGGSSRSGR